MPVDSRVGARRVDERFTIRPYAGGEEAAILDLFARSFPHAPRSVEHFRWKYLENPAGNGHISLAFDPEKHLVGHYAGYPVSFRRMGEDVTAHQIGDTMTDPAIRHVGRGPTSIIARTAFDFFERFCDGRVAFNYGFNVANIQQFSVRFLRSFVVEPVTYRYRDLRANPVTGNRRMARWMCGFQLELVENPDAEFDAFFDRVSDRYVFLARRDSRYLRWRYLSHPEHRYAIVAIRKWRRLAGWIVFRIREDRFTWGDALFDPTVPEAMEVALRHVVPSYPVAAIEAWFPPRPAWFDSLLTNFGFEMRPEPQDLSVMCTPFMWPDAVERMRRELYFAWGDSDLF